MSATETPLVGLLHAGEARAPQIPGIKATDILDCDITSL